MAGPTPYPDLNAVLAEFVSSARAILGANFLGAYLQGSFAVGGADEHSDVDFIVVTHDEIDDATATELQAMHERIYGLESTWAQHLEGSYVPEEKLRRVDPDRAPFLYLDNGSTELEWDNHCNTAVVRWSLREHGVVLAGPDPKSLVDPVAAADLRADALVAMREWDEWLAAGNTLRRRAQGLLVVSFCRMLQTLETGTVTTKREAGEWALRTLDPEWADLIQGALDDRPDPWQKVPMPADPAALERTLEFIRFAQAEGGAVEPLRGALVSLRPARESDVDLLTGWFSDPAVYDWWGGAPKVREEVAEKYVGHRRPAVESLIIEAEGGPVGYIQYHQGFEEFHGPDEGGIDMFVAPEARRRGLGRDAVVTLVRHLFAERGWSRVTVDPAKSNPSALRFWRACGFRYERDIDSDGPAELLSIVR